jgi:hypothetical protein
MKDGFQMVTILTGHWAKHRSMALLELKKILSENCHLERLPLAMGSSDPQMLVEQIVADYEQPLRRLSNCYTRESSIAEDLFQEIVLALCCALPQYRGECTVRTWVYRIAHNVAISFAAKGRRDRQRSRPLSETDTSPMRVTRLVTGHCFWRLSGSFRWPTSSWSCSISKDFRLWR